MTISMKNVTWVREGGTVILNDVNWEVKPGEHWALVGLNGSGKTTLLNMINGYLWPTRGEISVLGQRFGTVDLRELRKSIGWVSSSLQQKLYGSDTGLEIVVSGRLGTIGVHNKPTEDDLDEARKLLESLKCSYLANRPYQHCSEGERQRLLIARALISKPKLLILDEPCNGLDIFAREQLLATVEEITKQPDAPTLLFVTHHIEEILPTIKHALLLRNGEVFGAGRTTELLTSEQLSQFFGTSVTVEWRNNRPWLQLEFDQITIH
ncbi:UNVERIFIED_CONTAM: iron complex transport system ATP-binding protein [Brevibacillus sp. OAP136]